VRAEQRERLPASLCLGSRALADQHHEDDQQRHGEREYPGRDRVHRDHPADHRDGYDGGQHQLGEVAREVPFKRVDALHGGARQLAGASGVGALLRALEQYAADQTAAQLRHDTHGPPAA
jgi:hypothetical protein